MLDEVYVLDITGLGRGLTSLRREIVVRVHRVANLVVLDEDMMDVRTMLFVTTRLILCKLCEFLPVAKSQSERRSLNERLACSL